MPELPEVETIRSALAPHLVDQTINDVQISPYKLRRPLSQDQMAREICGRNVLAVRRRGKFLIIEMSDCRALIIHLGMTGSLRFVRTEHPPLKHDHVQWRLADGSRLVFNDPRRFGFVDVQRLKQAGGEPPGIIKDMGPEPLEPFFSGQYAYANSRHKTQPVKNLLLDQRFVAGIGNIYASEALWRAGISPRRRGCNIGLERWGKLVQAVKTVLLDAIAAGGTTIRDYRTVDGTEGRFSICLEVYGRDGSPCPRCGGGCEIKRIVMAGRATYYCSGCQN